MLEQCCLTHLSSRNFNIDGLWQWLKHEQVFPRLQRQQPWSMWRDQCRFQWKNNLGLQEIITGPTVENLPLPQTTHEIQLCSMVIDFARTASLYHHCFNLANFPSMVIPNSVCILYVWAMYWIMWPGIVDQRFSTTLPLPSQGTQLAPTFWLQAFPSASEGPLCTCLMALEVRRCGMMGYEK